MHRSISVYFITAMTGEKAVLQWTALLSRYFVKRHSCKSSTIEACGTERGNQQVHAVWK